MKKKLEWRLSLFLNKYRRSSITPELPLRSEIFSTVQMEDHGRALALRHTINLKKGPDHLLERLAENEKIISDACIVIGLTLESQMEITPSAEWLLDNFYLIEEQIRTAKKHLPKGYSRGLPRLQNGSSADLPRIYDIAQEIIAHCDARLDPDSLARFIAAYQSVALLQLGELWALPIMLRLALIENLRRISDRLGSDRISRNRAHRWAERMIAAADKDPSSLILTVADMARAQPQMDNAFIAETARHLQGQGMAMSLPLNWIEQRLAQSFRTIEQAVQTEVQHQAANQLSVSNSIGSLRLLGNISWRNFVESASIVEKTLSQDPAQIYNGMDFATRDQYRHCIENIAKKSRLSEQEIAAEAIAMAQRAEGRDNIMRHVGYYLTGPGAPQLERYAAIRLSPIESLRRGVKRHPLSIYLGSIILISSGMAWFFTAQLQAIVAGNSWYIAGIIILALLGGSRMAMALVNWLSTILVYPQALPRMNFSGGIPENARTMVTVPTMLTSLQNIDSLCEDLEVRYLANRGENIYFSLLTDFSDSEQETLPSDSLFTDYACKTIIALNERYASPNEDIFFLFHRARQWNAREKTWMGYERKRGKLAALNRLLRHGDTQSFSCIAGNIHHLRNIRYVITLDTDTQLPRDTARELVGAMAHPLNHPQYDERTRRITSGYGILQPRVAPGLLGAQASLYANLQSGDAGIDPYTRAISDVYQDLFGEGSFVGKGIYDIEAFEKVLENRLPDNRILSHDLLEGCYARAGLVGDIVLYEEYPSRYATDAARRHRWIRGDWQIATWLLPRVPGLERGWIKNPLSALSRWKIFDNLRRSVVPVALLLLFLAGWILSPMPLTWTLVTTSLLFAPALCTAVFSLLRRPDNLPAGQHAAAIFPGIKRQCAGLMLELITLPYEAFYHVDAILRVFWRLFILRRRLLEWTTFSEANKRGANNIAEAFRLLWFAPAWSIAVFVALALIHPLHLPVALPFLAAWFLSPLLVWKLSQPVEKTGYSLSEDQKNYLCKLARRTWAFFETYVGPDDNWLPPDNVQEAPVAVTAHRTSPTNMGLALLANLTAYDFGFITASMMVDRCEKTLSTMDKLPRYRGHFYNWYDTLSLQPLHPLYVSAVDSGNLAGHLMTLRQGLLAVIDRPVVSVDIFSGLNSTLKLIEEHEALPDNSIINFKEKLSTDISQNLSVMTVHMRELTALAGQSLFSSNEESTFWHETLVRQCHDILNELEIWSAESNSDDIPTLKQLANQGWEQARILIAKIDMLAQQADAMADMEYDFIYDQTNNLLAIGYNVDSHKRDVSYYDLLASEARLACFVGIARGNIPQESWFSLGRQLTDAGGEPALVSWSGSMFEYLMPLLVMPTYSQTLLDKTYHAIIRRQIAYGARRDVPWGISESGYNMFDSHLNYQYRAFGVPGLGLKRGLGDDLVIAPYATVMALMVSPEEACRNLIRMEDKGFGGRFGLYEAIDYTPTRLQRGRDFALVQSFMVHHQGMGFLSLSYLLHDKPMQKRFQADPLFQATLLLLHEKAPKTVTIDGNTRQVTALRAGGVAQTSSPVRVLTTPNTKTPEVQILSNGDYHVMVSNAGGGYSRWRDLALTRWREDGVRDNWGTFCYIRNQTDGTFWSTGYQPTLKIPQNYEVVFSEGRAEINRRDGDIETRTEIVVSPEDDVEIRRSRITNYARQHRTIDITSYAEIVLAPAAADSAHPSFSNLFVQTEIIEEIDAILATRRPRSAQENPPWMFHTLIARNKHADMSFETDRLKFIGRGHTPQNPHSLADYTDLSGTDGSVLDPVAAIRCQVTLAPGETITIDLIAGAAETQDDCLFLIAKHQDQPLADRVFEMAWTHGQAILRQLNVTESDAQLYARLAGSIMYANPALRGAASVLACNRRGQSGLWSHAISGDLPILLLRVSEEGHLPMARHLVQAHAYWRLKGLAVDLVIWNEDQGGYRQVLQDQIMGLIAAGTEAHTIDRPGGIYLRSIDQIAPEDLILIESVARAVIVAGKGTLEEQIKRSVKEPPIPRFIPVQSLMPPRRTRTLSLPHDLLFANGTGGFTPDGQEYMILTGKGHRTPMPWSNVLANPSFGTVVSESGQAYSWSENAHEFRLTPWHNDPICDLGGEAFYLRDEETGAVWSPTPLPMASQGSYITRHGFGYSVFEHEQYDIRSELTVFVAIDAPVKFSILKIQNLAHMPRRLSATGYVEWVLGELRSKTGLHIVTGSDITSGAVIARNYYNTEFTKRTAFFDADAEQKSFTANRREFIGRNGSLSNPEALAHATLSGRTGAGLDSCAAIQAFIELDPGETMEIVFRLGAPAPHHGSNPGNYIREFQGTAKAHQILTAVKAHWRDILGAVQIETPDPSVDLLANGWLLYQTIACRLWARSGYYQSGGAFGFRDQLQDAMAVIHTQPALLRDQILLHARHQFTDGDVQHWWHPPGNRGVRTKCSDDYLWLPLAVCRYVTATGDTAILEEIVPFIEGRILGDHEDSYYDLPTISSESASIYEHCVRALNRGLRLGIHGLPLIGSCDWNDGMDKIGEHGRGESVWLAFFLYGILLKFAPLADMRDPDFAAQCRNESAALQKNIETHAWDGAWYRRAYFDDGTPLGSSENEECQIDSLAQSWAVLSGAGEPTRTQKAMDALDKRLVRRDKGLVQLLDPPFDKAGPNPGYIRGYVPGVRENGGQYTHAAIWSAMAFARMGDAARAWEILNMINPINHARTAEESAHYKAEPYVVAADVYGEPPHTGRGGWTWYTGSSGWLYRLIIESLLGLELKGNKLIIKPCLPPSWSAYKISYRFGTARYEITIEKSDKNETILDGMQQNAAEIVLNNDGKVHNAIIYYL